MEIHERLAIYDSPDMPRLPPVTIARLPLTCRDRPAWRLAGMGRPRWPRTAEGILFGNYLVGVHPSVLQDPAKRAAVADYLVRIRKGYDWVESNKAAWCAALAPVIHVPLPFVTSQFDHESQPDRLVPVDDAAIASAHEVADTFIKAGLLPGPVNVSPYFDRSFSTSLTAR